MALAYTRALLKISGEALGAIRASASTFIPSRPSPKK